MVRNIKVYIECFVARIFKKLGYKKNIKDIPSNTLYCYTINEEKNRTKHDFTIHIKSCKYYRYMDGELYAGCTFVGYAGHDFLLGDQCKICGIKEGI